MNRRLSNKEGARNGRAKLTDEKVRAIRADTRTYRAIAADYGVHYTAIGYIKRRRTWRHID